MIEVIYIVRHAVRMKHFLRPHSTLHRTYRSSLHTLPGNIHPLPLLHPVARQKSLFRGPCIHRTRLLKSRAQHHRFNDFTLR
jgi:hypothetical protein